MAILSPMSLSGSGRLSAGGFILTASDTLLYTQGLGQMILLRNGTAGVLSLVIQGSGASGLFNAPGGPLGVDLSLGFSLGALAATGNAVVKLDTIANYLLGTVIITGGTGCLFFFFTP